MNPDDELALPNNLCQQECRNTQTLSGQNLGEVKENYASPRTVAMLLHRSGRVGVMCADW